MKTIFDNSRLVRRAYWLVKLRWMAIAGTVIAIFIAGNVLHMAIQSVPLYCVTSMLIFENIISLLLLKRQLKRRSVSTFSIGRIIHFQICIDLLLLTTLLHYSGGIENPFIVYFVFHMAIASILLPVRESYLQATFATGLLTLLALLEYKRIVPHYCVKEFIAKGACSNTLGIFATVGAMASTLFLVVYMTSNIGTKLREQETAYLRINAELKQKDKIKDEYVSRVTHDIKGHLAAIQTCLDVVKRKLFGSLNEKQADFIDRAHNRTCKVTKFVRTLLELTQMRLSKNLEMSVFSLPDVVDNALETVKIKIQSKSITLNSEIEASVDEIYGNLFSVEEVITNMLHNSIKYTPVGGKVEINVKENGNGILVEITDTGIGIPEEALPKVFDEFYRAINARKIEKDGTGLGLSIVKQIIERHNGKIWAESKEGVGSKFSFILPKTKNSDIV